MNVEIGSLLQDKYDYDRRLAVVVGSKPITEGLIYILLWNDGTWEKVTAVYLRQYLRVIK